MNAPIIKFVALAVLLCCNTLLAGSNDIVDAFKSHIDETVADAGVKSKALSAINEYADSPTDAITEGLIAINPEYAAAVEASDGDDLGLTMQLLGNFAESDDEFLAADASFYLARAMMNDERYEAAIPLLSKLTTDLGDKSAHAGNAQFYLGVAQAGLLQSKQAIESFMEFLQFNPDAPERLRVAAWRRVQELRAINDGKMEDVYQRMDYSRRRLKLQESGDETQTEQKKIVDMLAKLIKEQEKKESSSSKSKSKAQQKKQQQQQQQQQKQAQNQKKQQSKSQQGGTSSNPNGKVVQKDYNNGPTAPWSRLRERSRDAANTAIKDKLPERYRDIVEKYYEKANGDQK